MAMIMADFDNVFVGAVVYLGEEKLYVYKVNKKSLYVGSTPEEKISKKWNEIKSKAVTWVKYMERNGGKKLSFAGLKISSEEAAKRTGFMAIKEARESGRDWLGKKGREIVSMLLKRDKKGKNSLIFPNEFGTHTLVLLAIHPDKNGQVLLRIDQTYFFYDEKTELYDRFDSLKDKDGKNIIWPDRIQVENLALTV